MLAFFLLSGCCGWLLFAVAGCCYLLWLFATECQPNIWKICRFRARNYYLYMMICLYIYRACSFSVCCCTVNSRSSPLLQSQTANLATLPSLTVRPVPILRQNVMPILLTSVITSIPRKTNNTSIIKREPPHEIVVMTMGYILANCSFCTGRSETFNIFLQV